MNTVSEAAAMSQTVLDLPRDIRIVFGGTRLLGLVKREPERILNMVQYLQPINVKRESEEISLLRKLVQMKQGRAAPGRDELSRMFQPKTI